jgi:hypothetical protein
MRAIPSEYFKYISRGTLKVGRSIFPLQTLEKIKALNLTETMIPLARLMQLDKNTVLGVRLGQNMVLKKALSACREYERFLNTRIGGASTLDINTLVNNIGKYKVIPLLGDKGAVEEMPINPPEIGDLNDIQDIRNSIVSSVGLPPAYVFGDQASNDSLRSYVRYLRKLETIQSCIKLGLKHLATIELYLHGYEDVTPDSINVSFSNLVSIANIERLEFLDILVSLLSNYTTFIGSLKEVEGCSEYIDTVAMLRFTFQLISSASIVCPTANHAILVTLAIFVSMGTCTKPTLHNASVHLPKAAPSSSVDLSSSAVQSTVLSVTTSPNAPSAPPAFQQSEVSASIAKACAKPVKAPTPQRVLPAKLGSS